jgi:hypothetical protein
MAYKQFNGWNIVPMPAAPVPRQIDFGVFDSVGETQSPFTLWSQFQPWPGADWWTMNVSLPSMSQANANVWIAWLMELRGKTNVFQIGDPSGAVACGAPMGNPVMDCSAPANNLPMSTTLYTRGWMPNRSRLLLPGDYLQIGYRLHKVLTAQVASDGNGDAQINIWPSIREQPTDGEQVIVSKTTGLFRLAENERGWTARETRLVGLSFKCVEAR